YGGPAGVGFLDWIAAEAKRDGIDHLLFVSRDGYVLHKLAALREPGSLPASSYFFGSRVAFAMASMDERNFESQSDFLVAGAGDLAPAELLERIGVTPPAEHVLEDLGLGPTLSLKLQDM